MKADDPKSLENIDAVFVTVEPNGGSQHPSGKELLFAYLRVNPNHPWNCNGGRFPSFGRGLPNGGYRWTQEKPLKSACIVFSPLVNL